MCTFCVVLSISTLDTIQWSITLLITWLQCESSHHSSQTTYRRTVLTAGPHCEYQSPIARSQAMHLSEDFVLIEPTLLLLYSWQSTEVRYTSLGAKVLQMAC